MTLLYLPESVSGGSHSIALTCQGSRVLVGEPYSMAEANSGAAYIMDSDTGTILHTLRQPCPRRDDNFGSSVAINCEGTRVLVSANKNWKSDPNVKSPGVVYLYDVIEGNTQPVQLLQTFENPDPQDFDEFGAVMAMDRAGETIVIASPTHNHNEGVVYVYNKNGRLIHTLHPPPLLSVQTGRSTSSANATNPPVQRDIFFGSSVSLSDDGKLLLVGGPAKGWAANLPGMAYLWDANAGILLRTIQNPAYNSLLESQSDTVTGSSDYFGSTVSISGDGSKLVIGNMLTKIPKQDDIARNMTQHYNPGVYVFDRDGEVLLTLTSPNMDQMMAQGDNDYFGMSVSTNLRGDHILVGAPHATDQEGANKTAIAFAFNEYGRVVQSFYNPTRALDTEKNETATSPRESILFGGNVALASIGNTAAISSAFHPVVKIGCFETLNQACSASVTETDQLKPWRPFNHVTEQQQGIPATELADEDSDMCLLNPVDTPYDSASSSNTPEAEWPDATVFLLLLCCLVVGGLAWIRKRRQSSRAHPSSFWLKRNAVTLNLAPVTDSPRSQHSVHSLPEIPEIL